MSASEGQGVCHQVELNQGCQGCTKIMYQGRTHVHVFSIKGIIRGLIGGEANITSLP